MQEEYEEYNAVETEIVPCRRHLNLNDDLAYAEEKDLNDKGKNSIQNNNEEEDNKISLLDHMLTNLHSHRPRVQKIAIMKDMFDTSSSSDKNVNVSQLEINCTETKKKRLRLNISKFKKTFLIKDKNLFKELEEKQKTRPSLTEKEEGKSKIVKIPNLAHALKRFSINKKATNSLIPKKTHLVCQTSTQDKSSVLLPSLSINQTLQSSRLNTEGNASNKIKIKKTSLKKHLLQLKDNKKLTLFHNYEKNNNRLNTIDTASCSVSIKKRSINSLSIISKYK